MWTLKNSKEYAFFILLHISQHGTTFSATYPFVESILSIPPDVCFPQYLHGEFNRFFVSSSDKLKDKPLLLAPDFILASLCLSH